MMSPSLIVGTSNRMKQVVSLFLIVIFLFGLIGYYGVFWILSEQARLTLTTRLDENRYDEGETVTIKIPLTLAYPINSSQYERVDGSFEYNGEFYKLIKQKLEKDTLYIVCIRDAEEKRLNSLRNDMVKIANDQPVNSLPIKLLWSWTKDFIVSINVEIESTRNDTSHPSYLILNADLHQNTYPVPVPPPESIV